MSHKKPKSKIEQKQVVEEVSKLLEKYPKVGLVRKIASLRDSRPKREDTPPEYLGFYRL